MPKHLVIVESPAKARTIERYLGEDYQVLASYGHVRDLPENPGKGKLGVDVDNDFAPEYVIPDDRKKQVAAIEKAARSAVDVWLATDLDREGEAIAWHVAEAANVPASKTRRVTFNEITQGAILEAFANPRDIDRNLVDAQQARRIVDRLVGYTLSPLLSRKVRGGLSAGRVQSVALRLVVDREREIRGFTAREYWTLEALLRSAAGDTFAADVIRIKGKTVDVGDGETAALHAEALRRLQPVVDTVATRPSKRKPSPPFTTSTLQQEASRKLGFSPKRTMSVAQRLYEGVDTPDGHVGLITYMRTDSLAIAGVAMAEAQGVIRDRFGERYGTGKGNVYKSKQKGAQEAHESIRPTSFRRDPDSMRAHLKADEHKLYRLIWQRAIASQMAAKELETTTVELVAGDYRLRASATRTLFDGFAAVYTEGQDDSAEESDRSLPPLREGDPTTVESVTPTQHFTEPPPRYTEATLIKALEENGIGRPSTYAATISTIVDRGYVKVEERRLHPEEIGEIVTDFLVAYFGEYVDLAFTARMEDELDEVAGGQREWVPLLRSFFGPLRDRVDEVRKQVKRSDFTTQETDETCSEGHPMVIRLGRNGKFLACSTYPDHKETRPLPGDEEPKLEGDGDPCPQCGEGVLATKRGRFGAFVGCSRYPDCAYIRRDGPPPPDQLPFEVPCPKSGDGHLVARRARRTGNVFWGCSAYPKCDFTTNYEPTGAVHDAHPDGVGAVARKGESGLCLACGAAVELPDGILVGLRLAGGPADPSALAKPARRGGGGGRGAAARTGGTPRRTTRVPAGASRSGGGTRRTSGS
ncbi:MAG TPA: type I DNA topoisomerase [Candidatus Limnocylindrales bacterium]